MCNRKKNGELYWESASISPIVNIEGEITHFVAVKEDTTERREEEEKFRTVLNAPKDGILFFDETGIPDCNEAIAHLLEYPSKEDLIGLQPYDLSPETQGDGRSSVEKGQEMIRSAMEEGSGRFEWLQRKRSGEVFPVEVSLTVVPLEGKPVLLGLMRDLTEQKQTQLELTEAKEAAEDATRAKSVFLANISHEIRTPMNAILGFAEILDRSITDPRQKEQLSSIRSSGASLLALIDDILNLTRLEAGSLDLERSPVDTIKIFSDVEEKYAPRAAQKGLEFRIDLDPGLPGAIVADKKRLRQIVGNLVDNAIKFTDSGRVAVSARAVPSADNVETADSAASADLSFDVQDTGAGIPDDQLEEIFAAFTQRRGQSINEYGGIGLGLALAQRLVDTMGGRISVTSQVGVGSTFRVVLEGVEAADTVSLGELEAEALTEEAEERAREEVAWSVSDLTPEQLARLPELQTRLEEPGDICRRLAATLTINELEEFAVLMQALGEEYAYPPISSWGEKLATQTSLFDMDGIPGTLDEYPGIVE